MNKKLLVRVIAVAVMVFAVLFGMNFPGGFCLGDAVFAALDLPVWSNPQTQTGMHWPAIAGLVLLGAAMTVFAMTTENKRRTSILLTVALVLALLAFSLV